MVARRGITAPEMVVGPSAHAAYWKAAEYFNIKLVIAPLGKDLRCAHRLPLCAPWHAVLWNSGSVVVTTVVTCCRPKSDASDANCALHALNLKMLVAIVRFVCMLQL
jgi:hypothetical protein